MKKMISLFNVLIIATLFSAFAQKNDDEVEFVTNRKLEKQLNLPKLKTSDNDIDLRIFLGRGFTNGGSVLWIRKKKNSWVASRYDYLLKLNKNEEVTTKIENYDIANLKPNSGWEDFWKDSKDLGIMYLPNQEEIKDKLRKEVTTVIGKGYEVIHVSDGSGYDLDVKEDGRIENYSFHEPWIYAEKYPNVSEVRQYSEIIQLLEKEFGINYR
ncbi:hypothetical protein [Algoriphagus pacificus]|uniref:Uncharacterized protein n=1 Tax=Algoriphagus pacificus TaxID=2811234 RepID=A0ABS3CEF6_9BACT|nr:hypothetical protein [Algoriphagus pacificus]MBN7815175.1 hypothetical protein [Algoriphagus pacificus]